MKTKLWNVGCSTSDACRAYFNKGRGNSSALGSLTYVAAGSLSYIAIGVFGASTLCLLILLAIYLPQTYKISVYLTLGERELNSWLRAWGGGLSVDARKALAAERIQLLQMYGDVTPD